MALRYAKVADSFSHAGESCRIQMLPTICTAIMLRCAVIKSHAGNASVSGTQRIAALMTSAKLMWRTGEAMMQEMRCLCEQ